MNEWRNIAHREIPEDHPVEVFKANGQTGLGIYRRSKLCSGIASLERVDDKAKWDGHTFHMKVIAWREIEGVRKDEKS